MAKSEYPRVGSRRVDWLYRVHTCDMCTQSIRNGERFLRVDVETHRFKGNIYEVKLCDRCWRKHKTGAILEWWLKNRSKGHA